MFYIIWIASAFTAVAIGILAVSQIDSRSEEDAS